MALAPGEGDAMIDVLSTYVKEEVWNHDGMTEVEGIDIVRGVIKALQADVESVLADLFDRAENTLCRHNEPNNGVDCVQCARDDAELERYGL